MRLQPCDVHKEKIETEVLHPSSILWERAGLQIIFPRLLHKEYFSKEESQRGKTEDISTTQSTDAKWHKVMGRDCKIYPGS